MTAVSRLRRLLGRSEAGEPTRTPEVFTLFAEPIVPLRRSPSSGPTIVLLNDCRDQVNYGARALVDGLLLLLTEAAPTATILPIPSHWLIDASFGFGAFSDNGARMRQPDAVFPTVADQFDSVADDWMRGMGGPGAEVYMDRLRGADLVLLNGEGSLYRTNLSAVRELFVSWLAKERLGIPTVFVNGTVHLTDVVPILPAMVRKAFGTFDAVAVREPVSLRNLAQYAPGIAARVLPDTAFALEPSDESAGAAVRAIRGRIGDAPYFCFDPGAMPMDDRADPGSALHQLIARLKTVAPTAVFVASAPADAYIERIARATDSVFVGDLTDYRDWMALVSGAEFLASGRYHNPLLAAIVGCPTVAFASSSHKVHGACEMLDPLVGRPYDGTDLRSNLDAIERQAREYVDGRDDLGAKLREVAARRRAEVRGLGALVANVLR